MNSTKESYGAATMDQKQADFLGRLFNSAFNSALLYGGSHPTTVENAAPLHKNCAKALESIEMLTFSAERDSFFIESYCVDKAVNSRRVVGYFKKADMQSVTFERGVSLIEMRSFIRALGDVHESPSVKAIKEKLASDKVSHIRINYVLYRKVTADEAVIDKQNIAASSIVSEKQAAADSPFVENPRSVDSPHSENPPGSESPFLERQTAVPPAAKASEAAPIGAEKRIDAGEVLAELEPIMTVRRLLNESSISRENLDNAQSQQLNQDVAALAGQLKNLSSQIKGDAALEAFQSPQEMMEAVAKLRQDVGRSIELLKAAGKLSDAGKEVNEELDALGRETVIRLIREEYKHGAVSVKRLAQVIRRILPDVKELKKILPFLKECLLRDGMSMADYLQLVNSLVRELEDEGLTQSLAGAAEEMGVSVDEIVQSIKSDPADSARLIVLASEIRKGTNANADQLSSILAEFVERVSRKLALDSKEKTESQAVMQNFESQLLEKLKAQGMGEPVVERIRQRLTHNKRGFDLPKGVFDIKVTTFFLEHEIKRYVRYNSPFSVLVLSLTAVRNPDGTESVATPEETAHMLPAIYLALKKMLRDLDLVGTMLWISENVPFVILPMTDHKGANAVRERVNGVLNKLKVSVEGGGPEKMPRVVVTILTFDGSKTPDTASFIKCLMDRHKEEIEKDRRR